MRPIPASVAICLILCVFHYLKNTSTASPSDKKYIHSGDSTHIPRVHNLMTELINGMLVMKSIKKLCDLNKDKIKNNFAEITELVANPKFICRKCARAANSKKHLCKPEAIEGIKKEQAS